MATGDGADGLRKLADPDPTAADRVAAIFSEVFRTPGLTPTDDFFELGGDSLMAEALMAAIEREFGIALPTSILVELPTPERMSTRLSGEYLGRRTFDGCLCPIREEGNGPPIFWVHGMTGYHEIAEDIAEELPDRPIYGFRALGLKRSETPPDTVAKIAENYVALMREVQPFGPYLLGGQCAPGFVAIEMAHQLTAAGESVAGVILVDPYPIPWLMFRGMDLMKTRLQLREQYATQLKRAPVGGYLTQPARDEFVFAILRTITGLHTPRPFNGRVLQICTDVSGPALRNQTTGLPSILPQLESVQIGRKHSELFDAELPAVKATIRAFLDRVAPI